MFAKLHAVATRFNDGHGCGAHGRLSIRGPEPFRADERKRDFLLEYKPHAASDRVEPPIATADWHQHFSEPGIRGRSWRSPAGLLQRERIRIRRGHESAGHPLVSEHQ